MLYDSRRSGGGGCGHGCLPTADPALDMRMRQRGSHMFVGMEAAARMAEMGAAARMAGKEAAARMAGMEAGVAARGRRRRLWERERIRR
jgi:hypothetical protein